MKKLTFLFTLLSSFAGYASENATFPGHEISILWGAPFAAILLLLACGPTFFKNLWEKNELKLVGGIIVLFLAMTANRFGTGFTVHLLNEVFFMEYLPFVSLVAALYVVTSGITIEGPFTGTPASNVTVLLCGGLLASCIGTTGAAMLLIYPLLKANSWRTKKAHIVVFYLFIVANIGGVLTPLGDPPLFIGFLHGVPFSWTAKHLWPYYLGSMAYLLTLFYIMDSHFHKKEEGTPHKIMAHKLIVRGRRNIPLLLGIVLLILMSGSWFPHQVIHIGHVEKELDDLIRDLGMIVICIVSLKLTPRANRIFNNFTWGPVLEVAKVFLGIFITVTPVIAILQAGPHGDLSALVDAVNHHGTPNNTLYFWLCGLLSSFLDNAPTYLVFFYMAGGDAAHLTGPLASTLIAISLGAVFMGAMTYIGNAPNFMVRSVALKQKIKMPDFFSYIGWSVVILGPLFLIISLTL